MRTTYRTWQLTGPNHIQRIIIDKEKMCNMLNACSTGFGIVVDGSSTNTGVAIMSDLGGLTATISIARNSNRKTEDAVEYKVALKSELTDILLTCKDRIKYIWYEEPFVGFADSSSVLMMIRSTIKEILIEHKDELSHIVFTEVNNKRWKKIFLEKHGLKLPPGGSDAEKAAVASILRTRLVVDNLYDLSCDVTQDEFDACGIVSAGFEALKNHVDLTSKKAVRKFKFETVFELYNATAEEIEEDVILSLDTVIKQNRIPAKVIENGLTIKTLNGRKSFDNNVYELMGDDDKLLILMYSAEKYANILMTYCTQESIINNIDYNAEQTMVVYVWRKNRH